MNNPDKIIIHHTLVFQKGAKTQFFAVNRYHQSLQFTKSSLGYYCGYHWFIEPNGTKIRARLDSDEGCHTIGQNNFSIGVCLAGDFNQEMPTGGQIKSLKEIIKEYNFNEIGFHRKYQANRTCPGVNLTDNWLLSLRSINEETDKQEGIKKLISQLDFLKELLLKLKGRC